MLDWLIAYLASLQGGILRSLATELRAGGLGTAVLAFSLGALHAVTPGHGKSALAAYFVGHEAGVAKGLRVTLSAALLHVLSGFVVFLALRYTVGHSPSFLGRGSPGFIVVGYGLIVVSGVIMLVQSLRAGSGEHDGSHTLTAGIGLLPCPLTVSVLGFAWTQSSAAMVGLVVLSLALGISLTIGAVAVLAILARSAMGAALAHRAHQFERGARIAQAMAAIAIIVIGAYAIAALLR
jgi:nickel/cobalt exporter